MKMLNVLIALFLVSANLSAQERTFSEGYDAFRAYGYQPQWRWEQVRSVYTPGVNYTDSVRNRMEGKVFPYLICPWWLEDLYCDSLVDASIGGRAGYVGYVLDPWSGAPELINEWNNVAAFTFPNRTRENDTPLDLVVYCRDGRALDCFLQSEKARLNFLHHVFEWPDGMINRSFRGRRTAGINFYLPDMTFREKRAFTYFIRSVSMVIDSLKTDEGRSPYMGDSCMLYVTLGTEARREENFLSGIAVFVDNIYFTDFNEYGIPVKSAGTLNTQNDQTMLPVRLFNQFYLFDLKDRPPFSGTDIKRLSEAQYNILVWKQYFYIDVFLVVLFIVLLILYYSSGRFYNIADRYRILIMPVITIFVTEIFILFLYMLESMSVYTLLISMDSRTHYFLLALPLFFILINIAFRLMNERRQLP